MKSETMSAQAVTRIVLKQMWLIKSSLHFRLDFHCYAALGCKYRRLYFEAPTGKSMLTKLELIRMLQLESLCLRNLQAHKSSSIW